MKQTNIVLTITAIVVIFIFLIQAEKSLDNMTSVKSSINDISYRVRKLDDKEQAANMLAETHNTLKQVCKILESSNPDDERVKRLIAKFPYTTIQESDGYGSQTSYSINKGEKIVLCLRSKDGTNKFVDKNVLLFVALHEISHIMTVSVNHTPEFWDNFKFVLKECQGKGIYKCIDFSANPQSYCGITVTSSPFPCNN
jgi:cystathionine beta-lyase family protein involved in aluminum resistance